MSGAVAFIKANWSAITALLTALVAALFPSQSAGLTALLQVLSVLFAGHAAAKASANQATDRVMTMMQGPLMAASWNPRDSSEGPGPKVSRFK